MPKFLYTVVVSAAVSWILWVKVFLNKAPENTQTIVIFLILLFFSLTLSLSILFYFLLYKRSPTFTNLRFLYRKALRWASLAGISITGILALKAFSLLNILNVTLFLMLCALIGSQLIKAR